MAFTEIVNFLIDSIQKTFEYFIRPDKRINYVYLFTSLLLSIFVFFKLKKKGSFFKYFFRKENWLSKSAYIDYLFLFFNGFIKLGLLAWMLTEAYQLRFDLGEWLLETFGLPPKDIPLGVLLIGYPLAHLFIGDLSYYLLHLMYHKVSFLWSFHKVHHASTALNPITQYRIHPIELFLNNLRNILILVILNVVFNYLSNNYFKPNTVFGVSVLVLLFNSFGANLRHSHVRFTYFNWLENILISPFQHQIHHSNNPDLFNKNMGSKLALWDWLFGTLVRSKEVDYLEVGLGVEDEDYDAFWKNLIYPFLEVLRIRKQK
jgi:sterol desaturase/sphingolipid hydroxylase (fatty acid hydroxylase superfamily)